MQQEVIIVKRPDFSLLNKIRKAKPVNDTFYPKPQDKKKLRASLVEGVVYIDLKS